ncbi:hypothetical protein TTHERM_01313370 (macronuclear) [Tetrahymena thermophila SB210]|uniref:Transmembrane protein n=1 Tax=Tetrahymena thermophila (strain SB210) TaxID=312017 RepID=Q237V4_TETTS|nr:hypothetical protein TTHERM_01313370 [Tetrahymena thermophila SB210]EAR92800.3 hypothetical protein TTHERM_01313370 [Tetrahymena thermophila SB210]|eukprot:XP_001013045.3 hypothetical protein TTHERM_01313370 [Tetrahymena thermophila SB210]
MIQIGNAVIQDSTFLENQAYLSTGGAISLQNANLSLKNTTILNNKAIIGGGLIDEEESPLLISKVSQFDSLMYSDDVLAIIQQISVSLQWEQSNQQIQCIGQLETKQFVQSGGYQLNAQVIYKPKSQMNLQIVSNIFPQLVDSRGNIYQKQEQLIKNIVFNFDDCEIGQIVKQYSSSTICENCQEGKYSLNKQDIECQQCPESAVKCFKSTILLKNGYWRKNENTDIISYCNFNPLACQAESPESKIVQRRIKVLIKYLKGYNFYGQESFQQLFNTQSAQIRQSSISPQLQIQTPQQTDRFILQDTNEQNYKDNFKKVDTFKNMRDRWSYYSRSPKSNILTKYASNDQDMIDSQESKSPQSKYNFLESARSQYIMTSNYDQRLQTKEFNMLLDKSN